MPNTVINRRLVLNGTAGSSAPSSSLLTDLAAAYNLDGTSDDEIGVNDGVNTNVTFGSGLIGQCAKGDGTSSIVMSLIGNPPGPPQFDFDAGEFAMSIFAKRNTTSAMELFLGKSDAVAFPAGASFLCGFFSNKPNFYFSNGSAYTIVASADSISDTNWHHYVFQRNVNNIEIYVDSVLKGSSSVSGQSMNDAVGSYFGILAFGNYPFSKFDGDCDMCYVWKGRHLTALEISELYNSGLGLQYPF